MMKATGEKNHVATPIATVQKISACDKHQYSAASPSSAWEFNDDDVLKNLSSISFINVFQPDRRNDDDISSVGSSSSNENCGPAYSDWETDLMDSSLSFPDDEKEDTFDQVLWSPMKVLHVKHSHPRVRTRACADVSDVTGDCSSIDTGTAYTPRKNHSSIGSVIDHSSEISEANVSDFPTTTNIARRPITRCSNANTFIISTPQRPLSCCSTNSNKRYDQHLSDALMMPSILRNERSL